MGNNEKTMGKIMQSILYSEPYTNGLFNINSFPVHYQAAVFCLASICPSVTRDDAKGLIL